MREPDPNRHARFADAGREAKLDSVGTRQQAELA
jgi:hypothetical protein